MAKELDGIMAKDKKIAAIIVGAGRGRRAGNENNNVPKQYRLIGNVPILKRTINQFLKNNLIDKILPIIHQDDIDLYNSLNIKGEKLLRPAFGGKTRQLSVFAGLKELENYNPDYVLIHDGARPFIDDFVIENLINSLNDYQAVLPVTNVIDTIKRSIDGKTIGGTEDREQLFAAQTPQAFHYDIIYKAHKKALNYSDGFGDDSAIAEWVGIDVAMCAGSVNNIKITTKEDFLRAEQILAFKEQKEVRIGQAYDVHQFEEGEEIILGGVKIPHSAKLKGHSDADAVLHTICDAILGAIADGDIGTHFPPSEKKWKNEPSTTFVKFAIDRLQKRGGRIINIDLTIICELPKIAPHSQKIRQSIATICDISLDRVSIKATTSEKMGFIGRNEGLAVMANICVEILRGE